MKAFCRALRWSALVLCLAGQAAASVAIDAAALPVNSAESPPAKVHYVPCPPDEAGAPLAGPGLHRGVGKVASKHHVTGHRVHHRHRRRHRHRRHGSRARPVATHPRSTAPAPATPTRCKVIERTPVSPQTLTSFIAPPDVVDGPLGEQAVADRFPPSPTAAEELPGPPGPGVPGGPLGPFGIAPPPGSLAGGSPIPSSPGAGPGAGQPLPTAGPVSGVPEPGAWALTSGGILAIGLMLRRRRRRLSAFSAPGPSPRRVRAKPL